MNKRNVLEAVLQRLGDQLDVLRASAEASRKGAVHEESRAEDPKDMRSTETSYLARGQAARVEDMEEVLTRVRHMPLREFDSSDAIALSALVDVEVDGEPRLYFLVPAGGGLELDFEGQHITLVSVTTPVGRALLGSREGDDFELRIAGAEREYEISRVR